MPYLLSLKHPHLKNQVIQKMLNYYMREKKELIYKLMNGKILIFSSEMPEFIKNLPEISKCVKLRKINDFSELFSIFHSSTYHSFAVRVHKKHAIFYNEKIGKMILNTFPSLTVNLKNPEITIYLEFLDNEWYYVT